MTAAWTKLKHVFAIRRTSTDHLPTSEADQQPQLIKYGLPIFPPKLLNQHQVDLLVIERCSVLRAPSSTHINTWEVAVGRTKKERQPKVILESWDPIVNTWNNEPTEKGCVTRWKSKGYETRVQFIKCNQI